MYRMILKRGPFRNDRELVPKNKIGPRRGRTRVGEEEEMTSRACGKGLQRWGEREWIGG
jgi:hypothetical protein